MSIPASFRAADRAALYDLIEQHGIGALVTVLDAVDRFLDVGDGVGGGSDHRQDDQGNDGGEATHGESPGRGGSDRQAGGWQVPG